ncbi:MAG: UPF0175 family protein [SAR324 cluster bacterium]|nr:UPF0175 family protein [SAR324 cluster bacterium]
MSNLHIELDLPIVLASQIGLNLSNASEEIRRMIALFLYEHKRISLGKACELGSMGYWEFSEINRQLSIPIQYSHQELREDMTRLENV